MVIGLRYAIIRKPLVCWMAARGNLEVLSNSAELDEAEESPPNGAARPKLVPVPILSHPRSNSSGLLILNTDEVVSYRFLGKVSVIFKPAGVFRACGRDQGAFEESPLDPKPF